MTQPAATGQLLLFTTSDGRKVETVKRGKHYVKPRGYAYQPGTGPTGETCGSFQHHVVKKIAKAYHKCALARAKWTGGRASDILVRAPACRKWERGPS